jgi:hypothetical protein
MARLLMVRGSLMVRLGVRRVVAEHLIGQLLLLVGQRIVQRLKCRHELLHILRTLLLDLFVGLHVVHRRH